MIFAASSGGINWTLVVPVVSAITALLAAVFGFVRNRRTDTITLYSSFVDDLHDEVLRLRTQYDEDRKSWTEERAALTAKNRELEDDNSTLRAETATLRIEITDLGGAPDSHPARPTGRTRKRAQ